MANSQVKSKNRKCTEWPQTDLKHLTVKCTLCTKNICHAGLNFSPFCSTTSRFWETKLSKIGNTPNDLEYLTVKSTLYKLNTYLGIPYFYPILLYYDHPFSRYQDAESRKCIEWPQTDLTVKSTLYALHTGYFLTVSTPLSLRRKFSSVCPASPPRDKFSSVSLYNQPFSRYKVVENRKCTEWPQTDL